MLLKPEPPVASIVNEFSLFSFFAKYACICHFLDFSYMREVQHDVLELIILTISVEL
jgi:hypothetical protein